MIPAQVGSVPAWEGDVLGRKATGDFLYRVITQRFAGYHSKPGSGALCVALDAEWGAGKSFFVQHWSRDIEALQHPVVTFDAWINDLADDPLLGFMAQLERDLKPLVKQLPTTKKLREGATKRLKTMWEQAPKAVLPAMSLLAKGAAKKVLEIDADEFSAAMAESAMADGAKAMTSESLQKFFGVAMKSHSDKQAAIRALIASIEDLLSYLDDHQAVKLPLFVFIDELDRCRPDYAIRLLEGIKHLFDAQGICFVLSTNLRQLAAVAQAVYGHNFDGYRYLKRFFAAEYLLPEPDHTAYARKLTSSSSLLVDKKYCFSLGPRQDLDTRPATLLADEFALISRMFELSLRSQEQVFRLAEAASAGLPGGVLYCLYLFLLAAAYHTSPDVFGRLSPGLPLNDALRDGTKSIEVHYSGHNDNGRQVRTKVPLVNVLMIYHSAAGQTWNHLLKAQEGRHEDEYPMTLERLIIGEIDNRQFKPLDKPSLSIYHSLVRNTGRVVRV
jgi:hypothetical protein